MFVIRSLSKRQDLTPAERTQIEETVAAIRLRAQHKDPYEEWERQARKDAYVRIPFSPFTPLPHPPLNPLYAVSRPRFNVRARSPTDTASSMSG